MNEMQIFERPEFGQIRTTTIDDEPWFVAKDICSVLGLDQVTRVVGRLDDDEVTIIKVTHPQSPGKYIDVNAVNEPGMYSLILRSNKPEAKAFKRWITHEVLPAIRKTGTYATDSRIMEAAQLLANCKQKAALPTLVAMMSRYTGIELMPPLPDDGKRCSETVHVRNWIDSMDITLKDLISSPCTELYNLYTAWAKQVELREAVSRKAFHAILREMYSFSQQNRQGRNGKRYFVPIEK